MESGEWAVPAASPPCSWRELRQNLNLFGGRSDLKSWLQVHLRSTCSGDEGWQRVYEGIQCKQIITSHKACEKLSSNRFGSPKNARARVGWMIRDTCIEIPRDQKIGAMRNCHDFSRHLIKNLLWPSALLRLGMLVTV